MARKQMDENPQSRQAEGMDKDERSQITKPVKKTLTVPTSPEARNVEGFDCVQPVNRARMEDSPESARQRNNRTRDMRSNLGHGLPSNIVID